MNNLSWHMNMIKALVTTSVAVLLVVGCATTDRSARDVVGRWQEVGTSATTTFYADGRIEITAGAGRVSGRYAFIGPGKLRIEIASEPGSTKATTYSAKISGDQMKLIDSEGATDDYVKIH